ncbi:TOG array regulator of axonemal microtubules protein 1-like [Engraulis encrasicolus]|uniref:TOG array regulator of axonemal microtubules protein 1-like n=1 Tax=Engraulis encrasicolus TaxID=184585 RepID=UPI002FD67023
MSWQCGDDVVKNQHTAVSRAAMLTLAQMYTKLGQSMDAEAPGTARVLLQKAGDANRIIRDDVERALSHMVLSVSPESSVAALVSTGLKHRCSAVRACAANHLWMVSECEDANRLLSMRKDLSERFVHAICSMALDPAREVRAHAGKTLANLAMHPKLISLVEKCAPKNDQTAIKNIISKYQHSNVL